MADSREAATHHLDTAHEAFIMAVDEARGATQGLNAGIEPLRGEDDPEIIRVFDDGQAPTLTIFTHTTEERIQHRYILSMGGPDSAKQRTQKAKLIEKVDPESGDAVITEACAEVHYHKEKGNVHVVELLSPLRALQLGIIIAERVKEQAEAQKPPTETATDV